MRSERRELAWLFVPQSYLSDRLPKGSLLVMGWRGFEWGDLPPPRAHSRPGQSRDTPISTPLLVKLMPKPVWTMPPKNKNTNLYLPMWYVISKVENSVLLAASADYLLSRCYSAFPLSKVYFSLITSLKLSRGFLLSLFCPLHTSLRSCLSTSQSSLLRELLRCRLRKKPQWYFSHR